MQVLLYIKCYKNENKIKIHTEFMETWAWIWLKTHIFKNCNLQNSVKKKIYSNKDGFKSNRAILSVEDVKGIARLDQWYHFTFLYVHVGDKIKKTSELSSSMFALHHSDLWLTLLWFYHWMQRDQKRRNPHYPALFS